MYFTNVSVSPGAATTPIQALIDGLTSDGIFAKLDRLWIFAQATEALALLDLVAGATAVAVNSPTFTANVGYTGADSGNPAPLWIDTLYTPSTDGTNYVSGSAHQGAWCVGNIAQTTGGCIGGGNNGASPTSQIWLGYAAGGQPTHVAYSVNESLAIQNRDAGVYASLQGHWVANRSTTLQTQLYRNGSSFDSFGDTESSVLDTKMYVLCRSDAGTPQYGNSNQCAAFHTGGSLSATDATNFYNRMRTYMTAVGVP